MRVEVDFERLYFGYRLGGGEWQWTPQQFDASILSDEASAPGLPLVYIGVVLITTKRGTAGKPRWNMYTEQGATEDKNTYRTSFFGRTNDIDPSSGFPIDPYCSLQNVADGFCTELASAGCQLAEHTKDATLVRFDTAKNAKLYAGNADDPAIVTGFGSGAPEFDPWRYSARRLLEQGEADAVLFVSALDPRHHPPSTQVPTIVLGKPDPPSYPI
jgi:hypothetical protein